MKPLPRIAEALFRLLLAALVGHGAARFACALAGGLAFATAAMGQRLFQGGRRNRLNVFHMYPSLLHVL